jgi:hypothetical protein
VVPFPTLANYHHFRHILPMPPEIDIPAPQNSKKEGTAKASIGALALSVIVHGAALLLVGGYVIFEGVVPRTVFNQVDGIIDPSADDMAAPPLPEEIVEMPDTPQPTDDLTPTTTTTATTSDTLGSDIIISSAPSPNSFNLAPAANITSISNNAQSLGAKSGGSNVTNPTGKQSVVQFFGIKAEARRVAFLMDASGSMVTTARGGKDGYEKLKSELNSMVQNLDSTSEFNVFIFDSTVDAFKPRAVLASERYKTDFTKWISPYMSTKFGNLLNNFSSPRLRGYSGLTRMDQALTGAFESGSDTIFMLTDGTPAVRRPPTAKELADWEKLRKANEKEIAAYQLASKEYGEKHKVLLAEMRAEVARRNASLVGREKEWIYGIDNYKGLPDPPKAPPGMWRPNPSWTHEEILDYLGKLYDELYKARGQDRPTIHIVGYSVSAEDREFLKLLAKRFGGNYQDFKK